MAQRDPRSLVRGRTLLAVGAAAVLGGSCGAAGGSSAGQRVAGSLRVVVAENDWGSIAAQVGGAHVRVTSVIVDPNADPHAYEPTAADGRAVASADLVWFNGIGYDNWMSRLLSADSGTRAVLDVGKVVGVGEGGNPHRWYRPADVRTVIGAYVEDLSRLDPADAGYFHAQAATFTGVGLAAYDAAIADIRSRYGGTPVGASESIFSMLAPSLGLDLRTPPSFLRAVSEGTEVSAADKATVDAQITGHQIALYVYNPQNATPDIQAQLAECRAQRIPTATATETLVPPTASYQDWQTRQLRDIAAALAAATGR